MAEYSPVTDFRKSAFYLIFFSASRFISLTRRFSIIPASVQSQFNLRPLQVSLGAGSMRSQAASMADIATSCISCAHLRTFASEIISNWRAVDLVCNMLLCRRLGIRTLEPARGGGGFGGGGRGGGRDYGRRDYGWDDLFYCLKMISLMYLMMYVRQWRRRRRRIR